MVGISEAQGAMKLEIVDPMTKNVSFWAQVEHELRGIWLRHLVEMTSGKDFGIQRSRSTVLSHYSCR